IDRDPVVRFEDVREYRKFTGDWLEKAAAHVAGPLVIWTNFLGKDPIRAVARGLGFIEAGEFVWGKKSERQGSEQLLPVYETARSRTGQPNCASRGSRSARSGPLRMKSPPGATRERSGAQSLRCTPAGRLASTRSNRSPSSSSCASRTRTSTPFRATFSRVA